MNEMLLGAIACASCVVALFFWRFWSSTRDPFFLWFSLSFAIEAANRVAMVIRHSWSEDRPEHYLVRLASFGFILWAIWRKNRPRQ
ncbi:MAG: DUF5985 family protein [Acidobacteriota bacterium]